MVSGDVCDCFENAFCSSELLSRWATRKEMQG